MSSIISQSFNSIGHVIREEIGIKDFKKRAPQPPWEDIAKSGTKRLCAQMSSITVQSFYTVGHVMKEEIEKIHPCGIDVICELEHRSLCERNETRTVNLEEQYEKSARAQSKQTEIRLATRQVARERQQAWKRFIIIVH